MSKGFSKLASLYVNKRGELCSNLATSRSVVAAEVRLRNSRAPLEAELRRLLSDLKRRGRTERLASRIASLQAQLAAL